MSDTTLTMREWIDGMRSRAWVSVGLTVVCWVAAGTVMSRGPIIASVFAALGGILIGQAVTVLIWVRVEERRIA